MMTCNQADLSTTQLEQKNEAKECKDPNEDSINLLDLPLEIFLKICSYLEADFIPTLSEVCHRFEEILSDGTLWRCWVSRRLRHCYPALRDLQVWKKGGGVNWQVACGDIDRETRRWTRVQDTMYHKKITQGHIGTIDKVLLCGNDVCISCGRDGTLAVWLLADVTESTEAKDIVPAELVQDAHCGWVWDLAVDNTEEPRITYSGSFDKTLKAWDLAVGMQPIATYKCTMPVLSVAIDRNLVFAGVYSSHVVVFDARAGCEPTLKYKLHRGPVLKLQRHKHLIGSLGEDRTIAVWDMRAGKPFAKKIKCTPDTSFPLSFNWSDSAIYVGDSKGSIHLVDPERLEHKRSYELWGEPEYGKPCDKVVGLYQGPGSILVASDRGRIKCLYPSDPVQQFAEFPIAAKVITNIQYRKEVLAVGTCEPSIELWFPRQSTER